MNTGFSRDLLSSYVDLSEARRFVPYLCKVQPSLPQGAVVLSHDFVHGLCWFPGRPDRLHLRPSQPMAAFGA